MRKKTWTVFAAAGLVLSLIFSAGSVYAEQAPEAGIVVSVPEDGVSFHTELQQEAIEAGADHISEYSNLGKDEFSIPEGITVTWSYEGEQPETFMVQVGTSEDLADADIYEVSGTENSCVLQNLMLDTTYYVAVSDGETVCETESFTTSDQGPRNLFVEGITNVRDLGGWETNDGGTIRQGLLIRCGQLNEAESTEPCITEAGISAMTEDLGVKTEIDFRRTEDNEQGGITESPLGSEVQYYSLPIGYITDVSPDVESIAETFRIMADENNYPIIYHCKIGTDRTGLITYLLLALCDVQMDDIYLDYAFSNLGQIQGKRDPNRLDKMVNDNFEAFMGDTPQQTARNYLTSIGVTEEELDQIVSILVEN